MTPNYTSAKITVFSLFLLFSFIHSFSQEKQYPDGHGQMVTLPNGDISFVDELISFTPGIPNPIVDVSDPKACLGIPNSVQGYATGFVSLGTGGDIVLRFTDNALVNIEGPDLYVFEQGRYVEQTFLYVSRDANTWINVGKIGGGNALVDIGDSTQPGDIFRYIKLVDAKTPVIGRGGKVVVDTLYAGADLDAIAAIGSARKFDLNSTTLFEIGKSILKPKAKQRLDSIAKVIIENPGNSIAIEGHCDSVGNKLTNQKLSADRALAVKKYLEQKIGLGKASFISRGFSFEYPVATNTTPAGRERNRRVEIYLIPSTKK